jgi:CDP-diacylglycerol pyrophosphatase
MKDCDQNKPAGYLVVPTKVVHGIESTTTLADRNYRYLWRDTWTWAKRFPDVSDDWTALAVNAQTAWNRPAPHSCLLCQQSSPRGADQAG